MKTMFSQGGLPVVPATKTTGNAWSIALKTMGMKFVTCTAAMLLSVSMVQAQQKNTAARKPTQAAKKTATTKPTQTAKKTAAKTPQAKVVTLDFNDKPLHVYPEDLPPIIHYVSSINGYVGYADDNGDLENILKGINKNAAYGYKEWRVPTEYELKLMRNNKDKLTGFHDSAHYIRLVSSGDYDAESAKTQHDDTHLLYGYLHVFPKEITIMEDENWQNLVYEKIGQENSRSAYGYRTWRLPTPEEMQIINVRQDVIPQREYINTPSHMTAAGYDGYDVGNNLNTYKPKDGIIHVRLVTYVSIKEQEREEAEHKRADLEPSDYTWASTIRDWIAKANEALENEPKVTITTTYPTQKDYNSVICHDVAARKVLSLNYNNSLKYYIDSSSIYKVNGTTYDLERPLTDAARYYAAKSPINIEYIKSATIENKQIVLEMNQETNFSWRFYKVILNNEYKYKKIIASNYTDVGYVFTGYSYDVEFASTDKELATLGLNRGMFTDKRGKYKRVEVNWGMIAGDDDGSTNNFYTDNILQFAIIMENLPTKLRHVPRLKISKIVVRDSLNKVVSEYIPGVDNKDKYFNVNQDGLRVHLEWVAAD